MFLEDFFKPMNLRARSYFIEIGFYSLKSVTRKVMYQTYDAALTEVKLFGNFK